MARQPHVSAEPLLRYIDACGGYTKALRASRTLLTPAQQKNLREMYRLACRDGHLTIRAADTLCMDLLGLLPTEVYGPAWWEDYEQEKVNG